MIWCYMANMSIDERITWRNQCVQNMIRVEEVWDIEGQGIGNTLGLKTQNEVALK